MWWNWTGRLLVACLPSGPSCRQHSVSSCDNTRDSNVCSSPSGQSIRPPPAVRQGGMHRRHRRVSAGSCLARLPGRGLAFVHRSASFSQPHHQLFRPSMRVSVYKQQRYIAYASSTLVSLMASLKSRAVNRMRLCSSASGRNHPHAGPHTTHQQRIG